MNTCNNSIKTKSILTNFQDSLKIIDYKFKIIN